MPFSHPKLPPVEEQVRRHATLMALFTVVSLVLAACGATDEGRGGTAETVPLVDDEAVVCEAGQIDGDLDFYNWSGYIDPELIVAFESEFGIDVLEDFYDSNEAMLAKLQSGAVYDLIVPSDYMVAIMIEEGILAEIQRGAVPGLANLDPFFANPVYDPGGVYSAAYQWGSTGLAVNMDVVGEDFESTWGLVFDPDQIAEYPDGVSLLDDARETMGAALKYLGYSVNSTSELELQEASDVIKAAEDSVARFDSDSYDEALVEGEVALAHGYSGKFFAAFDNVDGRDTYAYVIPEEGATMRVDNMAVPTNAEHPCTAYTFIDYLLGAENGAALSNWNLSASPNAAAEPFIDPEILEDETIYPSEEVSKVLEIITDTGDFENNYTNYFTIAKG